MSMTFRRHTPFTLLLALALPWPVAAKDAASGHFQAGEQEFTVADAIAWRDGEGLKLVFSDKPFDRAAFADDGELDDFDFLRHEGATLTLSVDPADGSLSGVSTQYEGMSRFFTGAGERLTLSRREENSIAGEFSVGDAPGLSFDLAIISGKLERPGEKLPADGGEPGKVLLARIAAIHAGDMDELIANTPPEQAEEMRQAVASGEAEQLLAMAKLFTPTDIKILGGHQDGDMAWIDFTGMESGANVTGVGKLLRTNGRWQVESVSTSQSSD